MDWILEEVIDSMKARIQALENVTKDTEVKDIYKFAKLDEINFLREQLKEIEEMKNEEIKQFELAEEDLREKRADAYI
jgi:hypothetical protein